VPRHCSKRFMIEDYAYELNRTGNSYVLERARSNIRMRRFGPVMLAGMCVLSCDDLARCERSFNVAHHVHSRSLGQSHRSRTLLAFERNVHLGQYHRGEAPNRGACKSVCMHPDRGRKRQNHYSKATFETLSLS